MLKQVTAALALIGAQGIIVAESLSALFRGRIDAREFRQSLWRLGMGSIPVILATALFVGGMIVVQSAPLLRRWGAESWLGWGAGFGILREVGPVLTGLMISGRAGSNNTAELGTLAVTEQIDGLRALAIDPVGYLVAPRFFALILTTFFGTGLAMLLALLGAALTGQVLLNVHPLTFLNSLNGELLGISDVAHGLVKSLVFGLAIGMVSTSFGLSATGGPPGVGQAVQRSVVASAVMIFLLDAMVSFAAFASRGL